MGDRRICHANIALAARQPVLPRVRFGHRTDGGGMGAALPELRAHPLSAGKSAVLALVHDGADRVLLAHKPGWGDRYSILAGFVLPVNRWKSAYSGKCRRKSGPK